MSESLVALKYATLAFAALSYCFIFSLAVIPSESSCLYNGVRLVTAEPVKAPFSRLPQH